MEKAQSLPLVEKFLDTKHKMLYLSGVLTVIFLLLDFYINNFDVPPSVSLLPIVFGVGMAPYFIYQFIEYSKAKAIEDKFPEFLRNLAEAQKAGLTITAGIHQAKDVDYGALTPEIQHMDAQLSWGVPFPKVIKNFSDRMKDSPIIKRSMMVVMEAFSAGGDIAQAMDATASNTILVKQLEYERQSKLFQQVVVMYVIYFIFIGMLIALQQILGPLYLIQLTNTQQGTSFLGGGGVSQQLGPSYYRTMFLHMVIIQAVFSGLLAGQLGEGKAIAGLKHSIVMLLLGISIFYIAIPESSMMIDVVEPGLPVPPGAIYKLTGGAYYSDGQPLQGAVVEIEFDGALYTTTSRTNGQFEYKLKMPAEKGKYKVTVLVKGPNNKKQQVIKEIQVEK